ncbi:MAG: 1-acyl-sn-glycerol-3-phosphate acyltransferase [Rhodospirillales bacterium]|jgi:1-acyl-sn-glycerol-3-phosphate acyltransferase|nr:1-acyl-sn-glycerol-3-phosphate acyltransferase [Rhodospirillales bacterium]MBT4005554.1 1-acyl-sn-glycerol-3-phosphate acyltransferase [Rhodospirillales bacterium]MBT5076302.1 1-acyl-sn-glycerol-3-phosphate acyltransferase [Rhodospirillales bacterium]MBT5112273.1 1-acyl-sn-glycerol-3-phosphate acyltransferase [Rhodospirillales bacterium]MBT5671974.1 1-acyl-sn-glycerol-3-phosphate acyltransferase [Rhodospirillales bacterium]
MIPKGSILRAVIRLLAYVMVTILLLPFQVLSVIGGLRFSRRLPIFYHKLCMKILGIDVAVHGTRTDIRPVLFVGNHTSYLDIPILGSVIMGSFVAKSEIANWPVFGWLAKLQRTVFIERRAVRAADQRDEIGARLQAGDRLILFPEGTSNDGTRVLPFKSALFAVAERRIEDEPLLVQPFTIAYTQIDGRPMKFDWRALVAWYGDMPLMPHLWTVLGIGHIHAEIWFHDPVTIEGLIEGAPSRKALAEYCHQTVAKGLDGANEGATLLDSSEANVT